jgi:ribosomal protein S18 acetylase RimI-like enzyme
MEVEIRRVGPGDAVLFERIAPDVFDDAVEPTRLSAYLAAPGHIMLVALHEGEIVGQIAAVVHRHLDLPTELYIDNLGVTSALQRRGIARRLTTAMFEIGRELGCAEAWVATEPDNVPARAHYRSFAPEGEDDVVMYVYTL